MPDSRQKAHIRKSRIHLAVTLVIAALLALIAPWSLRQEIGLLNFPRVLILMGLIASEFYPLHRERRGEAYVVVVSPTFLVAAVLLQIPLLALIVDGIFSAIETRRRRAADQLVIANIVDLVISVAGMAILADLLLKFPITESLGLAIALCSVLMVFYVDVVNFLCYNLQFSYLTDTPFLEHANLDLWTEVDSLATGSLGAIIAYLALAAPGLLLLLLGLGAFTVFNSFLAAKRGMAAISDPLTKLPNRLALDTNGVAMFRAAQRRKTRLSALFMDLDGFKDVNDNLGHEAGDELLIEVGKRIQNQLRTNDTVFRTGGDEFAILMAKSPMERVSELANEIRTAIEQPFKIGDATARVGASIGIATFPDNCDTFTDLLQRADFAMFEAKEQRLGVHFYSPSTEKRSQVTGEVVNALRQDLANDDLTVVYQPIINISTGEVVGAEALARWKYDGRAVDPEEFVELAEKTGTIRTLTQNVLQEAVKILPQITDTLPEFKLSVNVSSKDIADKAFPERVATVLNENNVSTNQLILEITEKSLIQRSRVSEGVLESLTNSGIKLALDDFGTGYASFAQLRRLPFSGLKIDRSFVIGDETTADDKHIVDLSIEAGDKLGLSVTVEGIENRETLLRLAGRPNITLQGHYLAEPMGIDALMTWLSERTTHLADVREALGIVNR